MIKDASPVTQALLGTLMTWGLTAAGAAVAFFMKGDQVIHMYFMAIRVVEFSNGGYKLERFLPKNQHNQRKLLNFENWIKGGLRSFQKSEF